MVSWLWGLAPRMSSPSADCDFDLATSSGNAEELTAATKLSSVPLLVATALFAWRVRQKRLGEALSLDTNPVHKHKMADIVGRRIWLLV